MKINTKIIAGLSILGAMSIILVFIPFLRFEPFPPLEYDVGDLPIMIASFLYGPVYGLLLTIIVALIQGLSPISNTGIYGILMNIISSGTFVVVAGSIYKYKRTLKGAILGLIIGVLSTVVVMIGANLIVTPYYLGIPRSVVRGMLLPTILPFNLFKYGINGLLCFLLYKKIRKALAFATHDESFLEKNKKVKDSPQTPSTETTDKLADKKDL